MGIKHMSLEARVLKRIDKLISKGDGFFKEELSEQEQEDFKKALRMDLVDEFYNPLDDVDSHEFEAWRAQTIFFLGSVLNENHFYVNAFESHVRKADNSRSTVMVGQNILSAVREDIEDGFLTDVRTLVSAEVFADFLEMAEHLVDKGCLHPAASLTGAVLENGLRKIAASSSIKMKAKEDLSSLNHKCANAEVYNRLVQKKLAVFIDIRNSADHGKFDEYSEADVRAMVRGVKVFLGDYLYSSVPTSES
jgi:hypothetical protein